MKTELTSLPDSYEQFIRLAQADLTVPKNTCAMFLLALKLYIENKDMCIDAINFLRGPRPLNNYDIQFLNDRLREKTYLPLAYFDGATPQNNYHPTTPYSVTFTADPRPQDCEAGYMRLYLTTAGADSPRPIKLRKKDDKWYLWEYSSILTGIRVPASEDAWA